MMSEIHREDEPGERPDRGRILYDAERGWLIPEHERPRNWRDLEKPRDDVSRQGPKPATEPMERPAKKPPAKAAPPEPKPVVERGPPGRGKAWLLKRDLTVGAILERQARGMILSEIAREFGCCQATVSYRLFHGTEEEMALARETKVCRCGARKWGSSLTCMKCAKKTRMRGKGQKALTADGAGA